MREGESSGEHAEAHDTQRVQVRALVERDDFLVSEEVRAVLRSRVVRRAAQDARGLFLAGEAGLNFPSRCGSSRPTCVLATLPPHGRAGWLDLHRAWRGGSRRPPAPDVLADPAIDD